MLVALFFIKGSNTGKHLPLEQLQGGPSTSGDVRHLIGKTGLLDGSHGVTTTDDSDAALGG